MKNIIIILFLISTFHLTSQEWTNYNLQELNLYSTALYDLDLDSKGNLWLATLSGLLKYDGQNWTVYDTLNSDLPQNKLFSVEIDNYDNVWMGYDGDGDKRGIAIYNGQGWIDYNYKNSEFNAYLVGDIIFDKNNIPYLGTQSFFWTFNNGVWSKIKYVNKDDDFRYGVSEIDVDKNNDIWFTSRFEGLFKYSNGKLSNYSHINPYSYTGLAIDSNNNVWIINNQNSLMNYKTETMQWKVRDTNETPISSGFIGKQSIIVNRNNTLWIAEKRNLHNFIPETEVWKTFTAPDSLYDPLSGTNSFTDFKLDENGNFWLITPSAGVFKLSGVITDVNDYEAQSPNINIYPNPTTSQLQFDYDNTQPITEYRIINSEGKEMLKNQSINSNTINISSLSKGVYFLELTNIKGTKLSKKFVVE